MSALIAVYSKDDEYSFKDIPGLLERAFEEVAKPDEICCVIVGNKADLAEGVTKEEGEALAEEE